MKGIQESKQLKEAGSKGQNNSEEQIKQKNQQKIQRENEEIENG